ncbi:MAG: MBL fold metallo-hydrolase [Saprospiraceae bacterium]|nr:MBL fold metallo-hydrolase [Saprospiraceae bacterium]MDW8482903.1 MBL fold metallo-hydrolase [Saprospiraceae bacterium]
MTIHTLDLKFLGLARAIAVFVVEGPKGVALVETGPHSTHERVSELVSELGWSPSDFRHIFLSHIHFDHAGAAWVWGRQGARVYVHPVGRAHLMAPEKLYQSARRIYGDQMEHLWGTVEPIPESQLYAPEHGEIIEAVGLRFRAWYTPGHATHHLAWEVSEPGGNAVVFTGDVAGVCINGHYVVPPCPPPDINIEDWLSSIQLLHALPASTLYLTHFGLVEDKVRHLHDLEKRLLAWANWMKPYAQRKAQVEEVMPEFLAFVREDMTAAGIDAATAACYEAANPAFMSVAGLLRYWNKKLFA